MRWVNINTWGQRMSMGCGFKSFIPRGSKLWKRMQLLRIFTGRDSEALILEDDVKYIPRHAHVVNTALKKLNYKFCCISVVIRRVGPMPFFWFTCKIKICSSLSWKGRMMPATAVVFSRNEALVYLKHGLVSQNLDTHFLTIVLTSGLSNRMHLCLMQHCKMNVSQKFRPGLNRSTGWKPVITN